MIGSALQKGSTVYVYNEKGIQIYQKSGQLLGFTGSTMTLKNGSTAYTYDEKGIQQYQKSL